MAVNSPIITNHALQKMKRWNLSETQVLDAFNHGKKEKSTFGGPWNAVKKYPGYEIGVNYDQKPDGRYLIVSCWKRGRR